MSRTTIETRAQLEAAAAQSGRSLGQEVEYRLQRYAEIDERVATQNEIIRALLAALKAVSQ